jgi:ATP-dependent protease Clp ATPase subunit
VATNIKTSLNKSKGNEKIKFSNSTEKKKKYYSENQLTYLFKTDLYTLGVIILNCIEEIPVSKRNQNLTREHLKNLLDICKLNYSSFFYELIKGMVDLSFSKRFSLTQVQEYLIEHL